MTVSEWIKANKNKKWLEFTVVNAENEIIVDDRIAYLSGRTPEYNKNWKANCRGKQITDIRKQEKGYVLTIS